MKRFRKADIIITSVFLLLILAAVLFSFIGKGSSGRAMTLQNVSGLSDFEGKTIGVQTGTIFDKMVEDKISGVKIKYFNNYTDMMSALESGIIDAFAGDEPTVKYMRSQGRDVDTLPQYLDEYDFGFVFSKNEHGKYLCGQFSSYVDSARENGELKSIDEKWFGKDDSVRVPPDLDSLDGDNGVLELATEALAAPFCYVQDGEILGYDIDVAFNFCKQYGYKLKINDMNFDAIIPSVSTGKTDFGCSMISITEERKESVDFSSSTYNGGSVLAVLDEETARSIEKNKTFFGSIKESFEKNFIRESRYKLILEGIGTTLLITSLAAVFGTLIAFLICLFRRVNSVLAGRICNFYVKLMQGTPIVVFLMILYYVVFGNSGLSSIWVAVIGFSFNFGAYASEIMRSGIESIDPGQREAALALGFTENQTFFRFIFPQAAVRFLPVYRGELISMLKNTSIVGYIAIQDLTKMSDIIRSRTYEAFFPLIVTALIYFIIAWVITLLITTALNRIDPKKRKRIVKGVNVNE